MSCHIISHHIILHYRRRPRGDPPPPPKVLDVCGQQCSCHHSHVVQKRSQVQAPTSFQEAFFRSLQEVCWCSRMLLGGSQGVYWRLSDAPGEGFGEGLGGFLEAFWRLPRGIVLQTTICYDFGPFFGGFWEAMLAPFWRPRGLEIGKKSIFVRFLKASKMHADLGTISRGFWRPLERQK